MPIQMPVTPEGFYRWEDTVEPSIGLQSVRLQACIDEVLRRGVKGVFGTVPYFNEEDLSFLAQLPHLEAVQFWDVALKSIESLYHLQRLRALRLSGRRPTLDLSKLRSLRWLVLHHINGDRGFSDLTLLQDFWLWRYKPKSGTFSDLQPPNSLKQFSIFWSSATSLEGLPELPTLKRIEIGRCSKLQSLGDLATQCPNLEVLIVGSSGKLSATEALRVAADLPALKHLVAGNKLLIAPS